MAKNLRQQLTFAVRNSFSEGRQKHNLKGSNYHDKGRSYSYQTMQNRLDLAKQFSQYIKENYPDIKRATDVSPEQYNAFLEDKKEEGVSTQTLTRYTSDLRALAREINETFFHAYDYSEEIKAPKIEEKKGVRTNKGLEKETLQKLISGTTNKNLKLGIKIGSCFGLRAEGLVKITAKDIYEKDGHYYCHVVEKGGRPREVRALSDDFARGIFNRTRNIEGPLIPIQAKSLEKAMRRQMDREGVEHPQGAFHSIRKAYAQSLYNQCRDEGMNKHETIGYVNEQLGHSKERDSDLLSHYVSNMW